MYKTKIYFQNFINILTLFVIFFSCREKSNSTNIREKENLVTFKQVLTLQREEKQYQPVSTELLELSLFFSGKLTKEQTTKFKTQIQSKAYIDFQKDISKHWKDYTSHVLTPLQKWRDFYIPIPKSPVAFYPFSGPDFPNVYTVYPNSEVYILVGLEAGGFKPTPELLSKEKLERGLKEFSNSLSEISRLNYFMTNKMKKDISASIFQGTVPVFLAYFGLLGILPISLKSISLDESGNIHYISLEEISQNSKYKAGFVSLEIWFKDPISQKDKVLYYFSKDLSNNGLAKDANILKFINNLGKFSTTFKAASFLVHYPHFSKFKEFVLENAEIIVMDDTGPKIKDLKKNFDIRVYGKYTRPIKLWYELVQPELLALHREQKPPSLPFKYGYGTIDGNYHLIVAKRKE